MTKTIRQLERELKELKHKILLILKDSTKTCQEKNLQIYDLVK